MLRAAPSPLHRLPSADGGAALLLATLLAGCAVLGPAADPHRNNLARDDDVGHCARLYRGVDRAVSRAGAGDAQTARITGFPYLRINRFLADSPPPAESTEAFAAWVDALRAQRPA